MLGSQCSYFFFRKNDLGRVVQSPIKLTQDKREFRFEFCNFCSEVVFLCCLAFSSEFEKYQTRQNIRSEIQVYTRKIHTLVNFLSWVSVDRLLNNPTLKSSSENDAFSRNRERVMSKLQKKPLTISTIIKLTNIIQTASAH